MSGMLNVLFASHASGLTENYLTADTMTWVTHARTGQAMMFDSTGKLTWAPNNVLLNTATLSSGHDFTNMSATTGISDPVSGTNAVKLTATSAVGYVVLGQSACAILTGSKNWLYTLWMRRRTGTGTVTIGTGDAEQDITSSLTGSWQQFTIASSSQTDSARVLLLTSGDEVDIYKPVVAAVTYETSARSGDQVITTSPAYYGPRMDYNPATLAKRGLLREMSRTNMHLDSNITTGWSVNGSGVLAYSNSTAPTGLTQAAKFTPATGAAAYQGFYLGGGVTTTVGNPCTISIFVKKNDIRWVIIDWFDGTNSDVWYDLTNGVVGTQASGSTGAIQDYGNGWYRLSHTRTQGGGGTCTPGFYHADSDGSTTFTGDASKYNLWFGAQGEEGSFATSYIPTTTASVTRAADALTAALYSGNSVTEYYRLVSDLSQSNRTVNPFSGVNSETDSIWVEKFTKP